MSAHKLTPFFRVAPAALFLCLGLFAANSLADAADAPKAAPALTVAVVQLASRVDLAETRDRILAWIPQAAARGARVVVFPEGALGGKDDPDPVVIDTAIAAIRRAASAHNLYVVCGVDSYSSESKKRANWMFVIGPDGREVFRYDKIYDRHDAKMPGVFLIDGIPCSAMICADRWLRGIEEVPIQQGARITFELSANFPTEWVPEFEWYWYGPRALRNNVWVVFANMGNRVDVNSGIPSTGHGHSAIVAPDGEVVAAEQGGKEGLIVADLEVARADRAEALARSSHPVLRVFWSAGMKLQSGVPVEAPPLRAVSAAKVELTLAAAQLTGDVAAMAAMIRKARTQNADVVAFPAGAVQEDDMDRLRAAARENHITVVVGATHRAPAGTFNSAFVLGPDGSVITRYDQLSARAPFQPGTDPGKMWFRIKGVPAIVTLGRDALWTELAELAAVAGARIVIHLDHDAADTREARLRRLQIWSNHASFLTFTATVNVVDTTIWDDLRGMEEISAEVKSRKRPDTGAVEVYSPWSANRVIHATQPGQLIVATRAIPATTNPHHPLQTTRYNPQMDAWYRLGAASISPQ